jgi:hypothetical protein
VAEFLWILAAVVALIIACLVVREQTEKWLRLLAMEVRSLRNRDKRLSENRADIEKIAHQIREVSVRADRRSFELADMSERLENALKELHLAIRGYALRPGTVRREQEAAQDLPAEDQATETDSK